MARKTRAMQCGTRSQMELISSGCNVNLVDGLLRKQEVGSSSLLTLTNTLVSNYGNTSKDSTKANEAKCSKSR